MVGFEKREGRAEFIKRNESGIYEGRTIDGERMLVLLQRGKGMDVKIQRKTKLKWFEVIEYDESGYQVGVTYEPAE